MHALITSNPDFKQHTRAHTHTLNCWRLSPLLDTIKQTHTSTYTHTSRLSLTASGQSEPSRMILSVSTGSSRRRCPPRCCSSGMQCSPPQRCHPPPPRPHHASAPSPAPPLPILCFFRRRIRGRYRRGHVVVLLCGGIPRDQMQPLPQRGGPRGAGALRHQVPRQARRRAGLPRHSARALPAARRRGRGARPGGTRLQRPEDARAPRGRAPRARVHHVPDGPPRRALQRGRVLLQRARRQGPVLAPLPPRPRRQARRRAQGQPGPPHRRPPHGQVHHRAAQGGGHPHRRRRRLVRALLLLQAARRGPGGGRRRAGPRRRVRRPAQEAGVQGRHPRGVQRDARAARVEGGVLQGRARVEAQVRTAAARMPTLLTVSAERIRRNREFLTKVVGMDAERVASFPALLRYDLEGRLAPRFEVMRVLQARRLWRGRDFNNVAAITEEDYVAKFIRPFLVKVPDLAKIYAAAVAKKDAQ